MELVFGMEGREIGGPLLAGAVGVVDCVERGGDEGGGFGLPAEDEFEGGPEVEGLGGADLGWPAVGGGEGAARKRGR